MKIKFLFYSTQPYDIEFFSKWNEQYDFQIDYLDILLTEKTVHLSKGYEAICIFVNDKVNSEIAKTLSENGIKIIALRCAGFNNVDLESIKQYNIKVVRVPAYSPHAWQNTQ